MGILSSFQYDKMYSASLAPGQKMSIYKNPYQGANLGWFLPFIKPLRDYGYSISPQHQESMVTQPYIYKLGRELLPLSAESASQKIQAYLSSLNEELDTKESIQLLNNVCNAKVLKLSQFHELEQCEDRLYKFKDDKSNPLRATQTPHGQIHWTVPKGELKPEHLLRVLQFQTQNSRRAFINFEPYNGDKKDEYKINFEKKYDRDDKESAVDTYQNNHFV